ncbi:MAG TPA: HAD hydrolase family protein [Methylomusa anaerophila]|uniref:3-deoxy-D-manno-octulosonate 8-phosphate phosphatase KdsC n=1 Tax=Methylomusa anaerophila TaxID=1930071 RepID=A0A348AKH8_9FIRM|nr:HAD hydrolase family protein [Methylomusa anaerophila]BBB91576.1 3-deoxy-D-manno-octulosonate 8-phosphate phosphatase KdsC [Methylomusa anaerophila]HML89486.1 HAD hydrolase family protein [Methylomusa anaerophila]
MISSVQKAQQVKLIIFDVDGVLTTGQIVIGPDGEACKEFNSQDGLGIALAHKAGLKTAIITGRESEIVRRRGDELKIAHIYQGAQDKVTALHDLMQKYSLPLNEIAYVGDDINDLPVMCRVGLPCAVANAAAEVKSVARYVANRQGGRGAVREILEFILKAQGQWDGLIAAYMNPGRFELTQ